MKVVVVGAGAAGLAATNMLVKGGVDVTAYDSSDFAGGRCSCYEKDGYIIDTGAQVIGKLCETQIRLCKEYGIDRELKKFRAAGAIWRNGKSYGMNASLKPADLIRNVKNIIGFRGLPLMAYPQMGLIGLAMLKRFIGLDYKNLNFEKLLGLGDMSVADFARKYGKGEAALDSILRPAVATLTLGEAEEVSIPHLIALMGLGKGILLLERGTGSLSTEMHKRLKDHIRLSTPVKEIVIENNAVKGVKLNEGFVDADHVICATTAGAARKLMPNLPGAMRGALEKVKYSSTVHVIFGTRERILPDNWYAIMLPKSAGSFLQCINDSSAKAAGFAPPGAGLSHSCTWGKSAEKMNRLSDGEIVEAMIKEIQRFAPNMTDNPDVAEVVRWDEAICLEPPGQFPAIHSMIKNHLHEVRGLHLAGEYMYLISCVEGALRSGEDAVKFILKEGK